jgi:dihydrofolate synthase/folylpolyglutamate synthase
LVKIKDEEILLNPKLKGLFQMENLNLVIEALLHIKGLGLLQNVRSIEGVNTTDWEARFEVFGEEPVWILDSAHNPHAFRALIKALDDVSKKHERILLFGNSQEKDYKQILQLIPSISENIYIVDTFYKAINQNVLLKDINNDYILNIGNGDINDNITNIIEKKSNKIIVVTGSIFMVGLVRKQLTVITKVILNGKSNKKIDQSSKVWDRDWTSQNENIV